MRSYSVLALLIFFTACKFVPADNSKNESFLKEGPAFSVLLSPETGSIYRYNISNKTDIEMEVNDQEINNNNNSDVVITYTVGRDSANDILLRMQYEKIKLFVKNGTQEDELDADNGSFSMNTTEKLLGALKGSTFDLSLKPNGTVKSLSNYKDMADSVFAKINFTDFNTKVLARAMWDKTIEASLIRQNIDQFFRIFPDSSVHLREKWKITQTQQGEFGLKTTTTFFVKAITEKEVFIESFSEIESDNGGNKGNSSISSANLKGEQTGEYVMEYGTGMLLSAKISSNVKGTVTTQNVEVPLSIKSEVKMEGEKVR